MKCENCGKECEELYSWKVYSMKEAVNDYCLDCMKETVDEWEEKK